MKLLIVEDDENKRKQLQAYIRELSPDAEIVVRNSYSSGLREIVGAKHDVVLLDMTMPTYDIGVDEDGGRPQHYAGRSILQQMQRRSIIRPVIIVTQFDVFGEGGERLTRHQLDDQLRADHPSIYLGTVYYNPAIDGWKSELRLLLSSLLDKARAM